MEILETKHLCKSYGFGDSAVKALQPVDLSIRKGEFTAIIGPSGSGKSTLLHLLAGLDDPSGGYVYIGGSNISDMTEKELSRFRRKNIGFIFQFFNLIPILTVEENIKLPILMCREKMDETYFNELMETLDIKDRKKHLPGEISGGQQQRAAIARALVAKPQIIFADEPTGNLDSKNSQDVLNLLTVSIKKYNQTLVMVTHDPEVAKRADRIITIIDGKVADDKRVEV